MSRLFYCTAIDDEDPDGVVTYYAFCSESQAAADDAANDEDAAGQDAADDNANATGDDAEESNIASSQTGGAMNDAAMGVGVGGIAGILLPPLRLRRTSNYFLRCLFVKRANS